jgi:intracellular sulfur oxidation DsrE/DsrF family protein
MQRVVYQLNVGDPETQLKALKYAQNQIDAVGGRANIELHIVLFDAGVSILQTEDAKINSNIDALRALGVKFAVCNNTLKNKNIDYRTLKDVREVDIVPSGVAEIAFLQRRGYSYMKP